MCTRKSVTLFTIGLELHVFVILKNIFIHIWASWSSASYCSQRGHLIDPVYFYIYSGPGPKRIQLLLSDGDSEIVVKFWWNQEEQFERLRNRDQVTLVWFQVEKSAYGVSLTSTASSQVQVVIVIFNKSL